MNLDDMAKGGPPPRGFNPPPDIAKLLLAAKGNGWSISDIIAGLAEKGIVVKKGAVNGWFDRQKKP